MNQYFTALISIVCLLYACDSQLTIDQEVVLKIGKLEITRYEFEKNKYAELEVRQNSARYDNRNWMATWKETFIENCYITADAYEKQYDTIRSLQRSITAFADYMMLRKDGYLWEKTIAPIVEKEMEPDNEKVKKHQKLYHFDYIICTNPADFENIFPGDALLTKAKFYHLKDSLSNGESFQCGSMTMRWPFLSFWKFRDYLFDMKEHTVSELLVNEDSKALLVLTQIKDVPVNTKDENKLTTELKIGTELEMVSKTIEEINAHCQPVYHHQNIEEVVNFLDAGGSIVDFKPDLELLRYKIDKEIKIVGVNEFIEYYKHVVMRTDITDQATLMSNIYDFYSDDYLIDKAKNLGLYETDQFKIDRKNYQNKVLFQRYLEDEIYQHIEIDSSEVVDYYHKNRHLYRQPKTIIFNMYVFNSMSDAHLGHFKLEEASNKGEFDKTISPESIENLISTKAHLKVDMENTNGFSKEFVDVLLKTEPGQLSRMPVKHEEKYVVLYKLEEKGEFFRKTADVYTEIKDHLFQDNAEEMKKKRITQLKNKYRLEIDKTNTSR